MSLLVSASLIENYNGYLTEDKAKLDKLAKEQAVAAKPRQIHPTLVKEAREQSQAHASRAQPLTAVKATPPLPTLSTSAKAKACFAQFCSWASSSRLGRLISCLGRAMSSIRNSFASVETNEETDAWKDLRKINIAAKFNERLPDHSKICRLQPGGRPQNFG